MVVKISHQRNKYGWWEIFTTNNILVSRIQEMDESKGLIIPEKIGKKVQPVELFLHGPIHDLMLPYIIVFVLDRKLFKTVFVTLVHKSKLVNLYDELVGFLNPKGGNMYQIGIYHDFCQNDFLIGLKEVLHLERLISTPLLIQSALKNGFKFWKGRNESRLWLLSFVEVNDGVNWWEIKRSPCTVATTSVTGNEVITTYHLAVITHLFISDLYRQYLIRHQVFGCNVLRFHFGGSLVNALNLCETHLDFLTSLYLHQRFFFQWELKKMVDEFPIR